MEMEPGKLFIGGISWDTSEERLREYFQTFGEVVEAVIMKDRSTGRARGFGFVVFANASVAEKVVRERHVIDGRTVSHASSFAQHFSLETSAAFLCSLFLNPVNAIQNMCNLLVKFLLGKKFYAFISNRMHNGVSVVFMHSLKHREEKIIILFPFVCYI